MMKRSEYFKKACEALVAGRVSEEVFYCMMDQMDDFCEDDDEYDS